MAALRRKPCARERIKALLQYVDLLKNLIIYNAPPFTSPCAVNCFFLEWWILWICVSLTSVLFPKLCAAVAFSSIRDKVLELSNSVANGEFDTPITATAARCRFGITRESAEKKERRHKRGRYGDREE